MGDEDDVALYRERKNELFRDNLEKEW